MYYTRHTAQLDKYSKQARTIMAFVRVDHSGGRHGYDVQVTLLRAKRQHVSIELHQPNLHTTVSCKLQVQNGELEADKTECAAVYSILPYN